MRIGRAFRYAPEQEAEREKIRKLSWLSIILLTIASIFLLATLGQSEAMKTAWVSDILTAVPPMALLASMRYELREPTQRFPFGYTRATAVAFLVTSGVLSVIGLYLLFESLMKLVTKQHPPIGTMVLFDHQVWAGWPMMAALAFSMCCGLLIGSLKKPVAEKLHDKALHAESTMNRAEWMSEGAAIVGLLLVAFGFWWGDAAAAAFISIEIINDGWTNTRFVVADLMDESPSDLGQNSLESLSGTVRERLERAEWISEAAVRLREHGRIITGDIFVVLDDTHDVVARVSDAQRIALGEDWRLHDLTVTPVSRIEQKEPPRIG